MLDFEELDYRPTPIGDLMLRRRRMPQIPDTDIYEVKLGEYFLMTSLFHEAEDQLAKLGLAALKDRDNLDVVVGGLGLGYTAVAALEDQRISSLIVVDYLEGVIEWHEKHLVPTAKTLTDDPRCRFIHADFFALSRETSKSFDPSYPENKHDAILLDIDHTPTNVLKQTNKRFYTAEGLEELKQHLKPGGVFALWADLDPDPKFTKHLQNIFATAQAHTIEFPNPITSSNSKGAVYVATID
ncbi:MAG: spermidine synthase [Verrucomicrobiota bacterium]